jgi:hypothetical protein
LTTNGIFTVWKQTYTTLNMNFLQQSILKTVFLWDMILAPMYQMTRCHIPGKAPTPSNMQPGKPLMSDLLLCQCLWVKGTDYQNVLILEKDRTF